MQCVAYCTAFSYRLKALYDSLSASYHAVALRDVVYLDIKENGESYDIFFFTYGVVVFWNASAEVEQQMLQKLREFEEAPLAQPEKDLFAYSYGANVKVRGEQISLPDDQMLTKLAISHGLAQSVKLATFEKILQATYNSTKQIPEQLARYGRISLSRQAIRQQTGELFNVRSSINLGLDVLDSPDFFWDYPELEPLYNQVAADEELQKRVDVLNKRLEILHELLGMLGGELNHQHSSRLEWTIIWLIIIEVVLTLSRDVFRLF